MEATTTEATTETATEATQETTTELTAEEKTKQANTTVRNYVIAGAGVGLIPMPFVDMAALTGVQLKMLHSLAAQYDVKFTKNIVKSLLGSLLGGVVPASVGSSVVKVVPGIGTAAGMIGTSIVGGATTYAVGKVFIQHFESGGTFLTFDPEAVREHFKEEFEKGKDYTQELKESGAA